MTSSKGRRRTRSSTCFTSLRQTGKAKKAAAAIILALLLVQSPPLTTDAFTMPTSAAGLQHRPSTEIWQASGGGGKASRNLVQGSPIRTNTNQPLARLTRSEEVSLLRRMRAHPAHTSVSQMARQTLLLHNLPLVYSVVTKILGSRPHLAVQNGGSIRTGGNNGSNTGNDYHGGARQKSKAFSGSSAAESRVGAALTRDDLLHEGTIGLAEAIDRYDLAYAQEEEDARSSSPADSSSGDPSSDPSSEGALPGGARLGTYATYWIRARILRAIQSREHAVRFPEHALQASHRLAKAAREMGLEWGYVAAELADYDVISADQKKARDELRRKAGIKSEGLFRDAVRVRTMSRFGGTTPLDESWMSPSSSAAASGTGEDDDGLLSSEAGQEHILETLSKFLVPREVEVLSLRYGLVSAEGQEEENKDARVFRDYQAEAENDLFGPEGMLSHYSATPKESSVAGEVTATSNRADRIRARAAPALLPFKDIGKRMQFSGEYCRRTCAVALTKLTRAAEEGKLAESDFLLGW